MEYSHKLELKVRDYECDLQGVVNNSVYQQYLEHARHEFLLEVGVNFAALAEKKINLVVIRTELDYKQSLRPGEVFWVGTSLVRSSKIRFNFNQGIFRKGSDTPVLLAKITATSLNERGRPFLPNFLLELFDEL
ncbi:acyl-CoA thioesterase [Teredinibacter purpureus]|jgi:Predicted thioesterase|uniref:acyl-CoA thioesterase n=1 Tax=Teredinibacter purpureus TaxID=2731756 RepID=UPI0005F76752|nr:acyl-CoA thioesterase [Teredinibacter purpureus]